ncbi:MAG: ligase-associated DNA damage response endonuclease PdeM [Saprospiraceae bacterium]|nr:ligase-associated DNA damage response endonuclease PdeM [Saprospiraceae bacterium]
MSSYFEITVAGEDFYLHPYRTIYWPSRKTLIVADLHLGKIQHFIRAGIPLPEHASMDNFERLSSALLEFAPSRLLILGDLFHSEYNSAWRIFSDLRQTFKSLQFDLIWGNHDSLAIDLYEKNDITIFSELIDGPFHFTHYPVDNSSYYNVAGHLHPGVRIFGESKQSLKLPCFYFSETQAVLPAFGTFTGIYILNPSSTDRVVVIGADHLIEVTHERA